MLKILFIHNDPKIIRIYEPHLLPHFSVDSAQNGLTALRKLRAAPPSLVLSDYHLPLLSGLSLLKFMRKNQKLALTPFIFLTNHPNVSDGLSFGANDWLNQAATHPDQVIEKIYHHLKLNPYGVQINRT